MWKKVVAVVFMASLVAGCAGMPVSTRLSMGGGATVCAPARADGTVGIAIPIMENVTDVPVDVVDVTLDEGAQNLELVAAVARPDVDHGYVGDAYGHYPLAGLSAYGVTPTTINPGDQALLEVRLVPTGSSFGWTRGVWVVATTPAGHQFRAHTCVVMVVYPVGGKCDYKYDAVVNAEDGSKDQCGVNEFV